MFKRLMFILFMLVLIFSTSKVFAGLTNMENGISTAKPAELFVDTYTATDDTAGDVFVRGRLQVGKSGSVDIRDIISVHESWAAAAAADSDTIKNATVTFAQLSAGTSTWAETVCGVFTPPRNIGVSFDAVSGYAGGEVFCYGTALITGTNAKGYAISETVVSTFGAVNYSNNAFSRITSVYWVITSSECPVTGLKFNVGTGVKLGLAGNLSSTADVYAVNENATGIRLGSIAALFDATYDTYDPSTDPAGTPREVWYLTDTNLTATTPRSTE